VTGQQQQQQQQQQDEQAGTAVSPDDPMPAMRSELSNVPSLKRIGDNAKFTVSTVSVVATALTAFGLVTAAQLSAYPVVQVLAAAAAGAAGLSLLCALGYLALRLEKRNWQNNQLVTKWYQHQFRRAGLVVAASWLLIAAVVLAGSAGTVAAVDTSTADAPVLGLEVAGTGGQRTVTASVSVDHLARGEVVKLLVVSGNGQIVIVGETNADATGSAELTAAAQDVPGNTGYRLEVLVDGHERGVLRVP
jgi:hypothetical protein